MSAAVPAVLELRRYRLQPGARAQLVALFETHFIEPQEALGMTLPGQFQDLDEADAFVWLRGFADMDSRARALAAFYDGPVWQTHRAAANATMVDSDDVLLLRPLRPLALGHLRRPAPGEAMAAGLVTATLCRLPREGAEAALAQFEGGLQAHLERHGARVLGVYATETAANTYPRLPVREDARVFVWLAGFAGAAEHTAHLQALAGDAVATAALTAWHARCGELSRTMRLAPTPRSLLRGAPAPTHASAGSMA